MMLYILCLAAVALCSASNPRSSLATRAAQVALELNEHLDSKYYYKLEGFSHVCELPGQDQTTVVIFLTLTRTVCSLQKIKKGMEWTLCAEHDKRKYLHCALIEVHVTGRANSPVGYVCERGAQYKNSALFQLNSNCSDLLYDLRPEIVQIKLSPENRAWKEKLPIYQPLGFKWNASAGLFSYTNWTEESNDKKPKNPLGRQGISGRGEFPHLGEHACILPVIVREKNGGLQLVAQQNSKAPFGIPLLHESYRVTPFSYPLGKNLTSSLQAMWARRYGNPFSYDYVMKMSEEKIYAGPIDHKRNTDNAWLSIYASLMDDGKHEFMTEFPPASGFFWRSITRKDLEVVKASFDAKAKRSTLTDLCFELLYLSRTREPSPGIQWRAA